MARFTHFWYFAKNRRNATDRPKRMATDREHKLAGPGVIPETRQYNKNDRLFRTT